MDLDRNQQNDGDYSDDDDTRSTTVFCKDKVCKIFLSWPILDFKFFLLLI